MKSSEKVILRYHDFRQVTDVEKKRMEDWADEKLDTLFIYSDLAPGFAEELCKKVVDKFGSSNTLGPLMQKRLRPERQGKNVGRKRTWTKARLIKILFEYNMSRNNGVSRKDALTQIATAEGLTGVNANTKIIKRLEEAQYLCDSGEVLKELIPPVLQMYG